MVQGFAGYHAALRSRERHCRMPSEIIRLSHDTPRRPPLAARRPDGIRGCLHASQRCQLRVHWDIALILTFIFSVGAYQSRCDNGDVLGPSNCQLQFPIPTWYLFMICLACVFVVQDFTCLWSVWHVLSLCSLWPINHATPDPIST